MNPVPTSLLADDIATEANVFLVVYLGCFCVSLIIVSLFLVSLNQSFEFTHSLHYNAISNYEYF